MSDRYPSPLRPLVWNGTRWVAPADAELGQGFNNAAEAAKIAWPEAAKRYSEDPRWLGGGHQWRPGSLSPPSTAAAALHRWGLWVGLFGALVGNLLLFFILRGGWLSPLVGLQAFNGEGLAAGLLNIGAFVACAFTQRRIAVGMLIGDGITVVVGLAVFFFMIADALNSFGA